MQTRCHCTPVPPRQTIAIIKIQGDRELANTHTLLKRELATRMNNKTATDRARLEVSAVDECECLYLGSTPVTEASVGVVDTVTLGARL